MEVNDCWYWHAQLDGCGSHRGWRECKSFCKSWSHSFWRARKECLWADVGSVWKLNCRLLKVLGGQCLPVANSVSVFIYVLHVLCNVHHIQLPVIMFSQIEIYSTPLWTMEIRSLGPVQKTRRHLNLPSKVVQANEEESVEVRQAGSSARVSRNQMLREFAVSLCQNERRILYRLQHVSILTHYLKYPLMYVSYIPYLQKQSSNFKRPKNLCRPWRMSFKHRSAQLARLTMDFVNILCLLHASYRAVHSEVCCYHVDTPNWLAGTSLNDSLRRQPCKC